MYRVAVSLRFEMSQKRGVFFSPPITHLESLSTVTVHTVAPCSFPSFQFVIVADHEWWFCAFVIVKHVLSAQRYTVVDVIIVHPSV